MTFFMERLKTGGEGGDRLDGITDSMDISLSKLQETEGQGNLGVAVHVVIKFEGSFRLQGYCLVTFICMSKYAYV